jgi:hypothetical protein
MERGTWAVALQLSKRDIAMTANSMILSISHNATEAEAVKAALDGIDKHKPGFSLDQYLVSYAGPPAPAALPVDIGEES